MRLSLPFWSLCLVGSLACSGSPPSSASTRGVAQQARPAAEVPTPPAPRADYLDSAGKLRASGEAYVGLAVPVTFVARGCHDGECAFESDRVPLEPLQAFVAERVETGTIESLAERGAVFQLATVRGAEDAARRVQVRVVGRRAGSALFIRDIPPFDARGASQAQRLDEVRRAFAAED